MRSEEMKTGTGNERIATNHRWIVSFFNREVITIIVKM